MEALLTLNNNKILWGLSMILLNMGSKYVIGDLGKTHETLMKSELFKKVILMAMFFVATRDVVTSFLLTVLYVILIDGILHERRNFAVVQAAGEAPASPDKSASDGGSSNSYERYIHNVNLISQIQL